MGKFLLMPKLGMTMESGKIMKWLCKVGDRLEKGDSFVEVQTDKVSLEVDTIYEGTILKFYCNEGDEVPVTREIAYIGESGEKAPDIDGNMISNGEAVPVKEEPKVEVKEALKIRKDEMEVKSDLVVIGGGPGGYVAAIRAAKLGAKVILVEKDKLGGVCLNKGCIPTKSLVKNADVWISIKNADSMGISVMEAGFDWGKVISRKNAVVKQLVNGVEGLLKKNGVKVVSGNAKVLDSSTVKIEISGGSKEEEIKTRYILIATGTVPSRVNINTEPGVEIMDTYEVLNLNSLPKSMVIIGGGYIGSELASVFNAFGVDVSIVEVLPTILSVVDGDIVKVVQDEFTRRGIKLYTGIGVNKICKSGANYQIILSDGKTVETEKILMAVGRKPDDSAFISLGLKVNEKGYIEVNDRMETSIKNVLAIGDITGKIQLAHVASAQGIAAVENLFGKENHMSYDVVPSCIFTNPEVAYVGMTEKQVKEKNIPYKVFKFPFYVSGKALALGDTRGFVKIIADSRWDEILGVHIVGPEAINIITEAVVAMKMEATVEDLAYTIHPHPTLSEAIMEASEGIIGKATHI